MIPAASGSFLPRTDSMEGRCSYVPQVSQLPQLPHVSQVCTFLRPSRWVAVQPGLATGGSSSSSSLAGAQSASPAAPGAPGQEEVQDLAVPVVLLVHCTDQLCISCQRHHDRCAHQCGALGLSTSEQAGGEPVTTSTQHPAVAAFFSSSPHLPAGGPGTRSRRSRLC